MRDEGNRNGRAMNPINMRAFTDHHPEFQMSLQSSTFVVPTVERNIAKKNI